MTTEWCVDGTTATMIQVRHEMEPVHVETAYVTVIYWGSGSLTE